MPGLALTVAGLGSDSRRAWLGLIHSHAEVDNARNYDSLGFQAVSGIRLTHLQATLANVGVNFAMRVLMVLSEIARPRLFLVPSAPGNLHLRLRSIWV